MRIQPLFTNENEIFSINTILKNRGIIDTFHYLNTSDEDISSPLALGEDAIIQGAKILINCIASNQDALIVIDSDADGFTSSAILINYLYKIFPAWVENHLKWVQHEGKQHGLEDQDLEYQGKLIICPDSASNDYSRHAYYKNNNIDILILDHHEADKISEDACVINNQLSDYPNKQLSGAGVTWQFCRFIDSLLNINYAESLIDLVALGLIADMMDLTSIETKHLIAKGLKEENVQNPFIYEMWQKNQFSLGDTLTPNGVAFYIAPFINAITRSGTMEEKELVFSSLLNHKAFKNVPSTKRGHAPGDTERIVDQALRVCTNVKKRQTDAQNRGLELLESMIEEQDLLSHKVLLFLLEPGQVEDEVRGLIANKFMAKYQRPCCLLTKTVKIVQATPEEEAKLNLPFSGEVFKTVISYQGSARGYEKSGITTFKDICETTGLVMYAQGHQNAFGLGILQENLDKFRDALDLALKEINNEPVYYVDKIYYGSNVIAEDIKTIAKYECLWGKGVSEPLIAIKGLTISKENVILMSPDKKPTLKITLPNKVCLIKFGSSQEEYENFIKQGYTVLDIVGRCNLNIWNGYETAQILIEDYEVTGHQKYFF